jgi:glycosidase
VFYEIFVRAFYDSDGDGIGDFKGITEKLDYLNDGDPVTDDDLGVNGIWLMPINESPSYHGYDVTDYYKVNPEYGTMADFENLLKEAHKRDIKVIIDLVLNHTSAQHQWFQESANNPASPYRDWFVWAKDKDDTGQSSAASGSSLWHALNGGAYKGVFWDQMPDLNFDNPKVREEVGKIGRYWLEKGVDGFRLDAVKHVYIDASSDVNNSTAMKKNVEMWQQFRNDIHIADKNAFLVGEVWDNASAIAPYLNKALDSAFDFDLAQLILSSLKDETHSNLAAYLNGVSAEYDRAAKGQYVSSTFLSNHDQTRVMSALSDDRNKAKMAANILLTLPGVPFLYYGEELGMTGRKPDEELRLPFPWYKSGQGKGQTSWYQSGFYDVTNFENAYEVQLKKPDSLLNHYKNMIKLRNQNGALLEGKIGEYANDNIHVEMYTRSLGKQKLLVSHNVSFEQQSINLHSNDGDNFNKILYASNEGVNFTEKSLQIPAYTTVILQAN